MAESADSLESLRKASTVDEVKEALRKCGGDGAVTADMLYEVVVRVVAGGWAECIGEEARRALLDPVLYGSGGGDGGDSAPLAVALSRAVSAKGD
jgi:hypothetical protein